ncbi:MAG: sigma-70 family RNA polymerase sigma factor [Deltaproteobacteria bacterium]|nr:sigma-70 family RNA polymerase sigma factor [Deltaproteobacteria bacterium]
MSARLACRSTEVSSPEDAALVARLREGDEAAFSSLYDLYSPALLRLATVFVRTRAVAEEVVQETWMGVLDGVAAFEGRSSLKTWVFTILTNRAKTRGVREGRSIPFSAIAGDSASEDDPAVDPARFKPNGMWSDPPRRWNDDTPEKLLATHQTLSFLNDAIAALPANQRAVVTLRDIEGLDADEVCNILEISETNQRVLLHRARSHLRRAIEAYESDEVPC